MGTEDDAKRGRSEAKLRGIVDRSGYPLQIALRDAIEKNLQKHWRVASDEHPWVTEDGEVGYIDLAIEQAGESVFFGTTFVVECKRSHQGDLVFLVPADDADIRGRARCIAQEPGRGVSWREFEVRPTTYESRFCAVDKSANDVLEKTANGLVRATHEYARADAELRGRDRRHVWIPAIVTTGTLAVCVFPPDKVPLVSGTLGEAEFKQVDCVRFRKSIVQSHIAHVVAQRDASEPGGVAAALEKTVFVVRADSFAERFLGCWGVDQVS